MTRPWIFTSLAGTRKLVARNLKVASPNAVRAVSHRVRLVSIGRMKPSHPMGSAMPIELASPRVMPVGPLVSDWTRQVGALQAHVADGAFRWRTPGRFA